MAQLLKLYLCYYDKGTWNNQATLILHIKFS